MGFCASIGSGLSWVLLGVNLARHEVFVIVLLGYFIGIFTNILTWLREASLIVFSQKETAGKSTAWYVSLMTVAITPSAFISGYIGDNFGSQAILFGIFFIYLICAFLFLKINYTSAHNMYLNKPIKDTWEYYKNLWRIDMRIRGDITRAACLAPQTSAVFVFSILILSIDSSLTMLGLIVSTGMLIGLIGQVFIPKRIDIKNKKNNSATTIKYICF